MWRLGGDPYTTYQLMQHCVHEGNDRFALNDAQTADCKPECNELRGSAAHHCWVALLHGAPRLSGRRACMHQHTHLGLRNLLTADRRECLDPPMTAVHLYRMLCLPRRGLVRWEAICCTGDELRLSATHPEASRLVRVSDP